MVKRHFLMLEPVELAELDRPTTGVGGFQSFKKKLQTKLNNATATITLTDEDIAEIQHHAFDHKEGGFQDQLLAIFGRVLGPKLGRDD